MKVMHLLKLVANLHTINLHNCDQKKAQCSLQLKNLQPLLIQKFTSNYTKTVIHPVNIVE